MDRRLTALYWHLAERWGRVSNDGMVVPMALTRRRLGQLVGARQPTVSTALSMLADRGELVRRPDGSWLLGGDPPETEVPVPRPRFGAPAHRQSFVRAPRRIDRQPTDAADGRGASRSAA